jgi:hypothetical protein
LNLTIYAIRSWILAPKEHEHLGMHSQSTVNYCNKVFKINICLPPNFTICFLQIQTTYSSHFAKKECLGKRMRLHRICSRICRADDWQSDCAIFTHLLASAPETRTTACDQRCVYPRLYFWSAIIFVINLLFDSTQSNTRCLLLWIKCQNVGLSPDSLFGSALPSICLD